MKRFVVFVFWICAVCCGPELFAVWSVQEDDPRPREPKIYYQVFTKQQWQSSNFAKEEDLKWFRDAKFGMFVTYGLCIKPLHAA